VSDMKRAAQALVATRTERFESLHPLAESRTRLDAALARMRVVHDGRFVPHWREEAGHAVLEGEFLPPRGVQGLLRALSVLMALLVVASGYVIATVHEGSLRFLLPLATLLAILGLPLLTLGLSSQREALESRVRRAIRVALLDADEKFPPPQRWADED